MTVRFTRPQLVELYCAQKLSASAIGRYFTVSDWRVRRALKAYGIELRSAGGSGVHGVSWCRHTRKWRVTVYVKRKQKTIGRFATLEEAAAARSKA